MAIVKKPVAKKIEEVPKEEVKKEVAKKSPEMAQKQSKTVPAPVIPKEEKKPPKTKPQEPKQAKEETKEPEKFPANVKTTKSEFNKVDEFVEGNYVFMDEGNEKATVFRIVYVGKKRYLVDITSKGEMLESMMELTEEEVKIGEADGCKFAVYQKVK